MGATWQQILAVDVKYNSLRAVLNPQFRTLYIRRRSQLLKEAERNSSGAVTGNPYLRLRKLLLQLKYGVSFDQLSSKSRSLSVRSNSRITIESGSTEDIKVNYLNSGPLSITDSESTCVVPTNQAKASRAIVGDSTISENYAFAGVKHIFDQHKVGVVNVKFANNEKYLLACASIDGRLSICDMALNPPSVTILRGHTSTVNSFNWSLSNDLIVSASDDGSIRLWSTSNGNCIRVIKDQSGSQVKSCVFQPINNNMIVAGNSSGLVQVLNISTGMYPKGGSSYIPGQVLSISFEPSGKMFWTGDDKGVITSFLFDLSAGKLIKCKRILLCEGVPVTCVSCRLWVSREARNPCLLVNVAANAVCLYKITGDDGNLQLSKKYPIKHRNKTSAIHSSFCPLMSFREGAVVVTGSEDGIIYFFDIEKSHKACVNKLQGHSDAVLDVCFNYDESLLASSDNYGCVIVWNRQNDLNSNAGN